jgi:hypothetical protein
MQLLSDGANLIVVSNGDNTLTTYSELSYDGSLFSTSNIFASGYNKLSLYRKDVGWVPLTTSTITPNTSVIVFNVSGLESNTYWANIQAGIDGQHLNMVYYNNSANISNVTANFGVNGLGSGSGLKSEIIFQQNCESVTLIYLNDLNIWQILHTGAQVA